MLLVPPYPNRNPTPVSRLSLFRNSTTQSLTSALSLRVYSSNMFYRLSIALLRHPYPVDAISGRQVSLLSFYDGCDYQCIFRWCPFTSTTYVDIILSKTVTVNNYLLVAGGRIELPPNWLMRPASHLVNPQLKLYCS